MTSDRDGLRAGLLLCLATLVASCGHAPPRVSATTVEVVGLGMCPGDGRNPCIELRVTNGTDHPISFGVSGRTDRSPLNCDNYYFGDPGLGDLCVTHGKVRVIRAGGSGLIWVDGRREDLYRGLYVRDEDGVEYNVKPSSATDRR